MVPTRDHLSQKRPYTTKQTEPLIKVSICLCHWPLHCWHKGNLKQVTRAAGYTWAQLLLIKADLLLLCRLYYPPVIETNAESFTQYLPLKPAATWWQVNLCPCHLWKGKELTLTRIDTFWLWDFLFWLHFLSQLHYTRTQRVWPTYLGSYIAKQKTKESTS